MHHRHAHSYLADGALAFILLTVPLIHSRMACHGCLLLLLLALLCLPCSACALAWYAMAPCLAGMLRVSKAPLVMQVYQRGAPGMWCRAAGSRAQTAGSPPMRVRTRPPGWSCTCPTMCASSPCSTTPSPMVITGPATSGERAHHLLFCLLSSVNPAWPYQACLPLSRLTSSDFADDPSWHDLDQAFERGRCMLLLIQSFSMVCWCLFHGLCVCVALHVLITDKLSCCIGCFMLSC